MFVTLTLLLKDSHWLILNLFQASIDLSHSLARTFFCKWLHCDLILIWLSMNTPLSLARSYADCSYLACCNVQRILYVATYSYLSILFMDIDAPNTAIAHYIAAVDILPLICGYSGPRRGTWYHLSDIHIHFHAHNPAIHR